MIVGDDGRDVVGHVAEFVVVVHRVVALEQQFLALLESAVHTELAEIADALHFAVDISIQLEARADAGEALPVVVVAEQEFVNVTADAGGVKGIRFPFER